MSCFFICLNEVCAVYNGYNYGYLVEQKPKGSVTADSANALLILICENEQFSPTAATKQLHCEVKLWDAELLHHNNNNNKKEQRCVAALSAKSPGITTVVDVGFF